MVVAVLYAFVVLVDPWGSLPLDLPLDRVPVTSNQRFAYPMLARSDAFDSAMFGTSTTRLLRPAALNPAFGVALRQPGDERCHRRTRCRA